MRGKGGCDEEAVHAGAVIEAVRPPERRKLIARALMSALAATVGAMARCAGRRVDPGAPYGIGGALRLLDAQGAGADKSGAARDTRRQPAHIGREGLHLAAVERQPLSVQAALHAAIDPFLQRDDRAFARAIAREVLPGADQRHGKRLAARLQMAVPAGEVVAGKTL